MISKISLKLQQKSYTKLKKRKARVYKEVNTTQRFKMKMETLSQFKNNRLIVQFVILNSMVGICLMLVSHST